LNPQPFIPSRRKPGLVKINRNAGRRILYGPGWDTGVFFIWQLQYGNIECLNKEADMPVISVFYGIIVYIFSYDNKRHHRPHIHVKCGEFEAGIAIDDGAILYGALPI
jgi:hypothetical protein